MRIQNHHPQLSGLERGPSCHITIDGQRYKAFFGETIATVLLAYGRSPSPTGHANQPGLAGFYCGIGHCYGCLMAVDGRPQRTCTTTVRPEMVISTILGSED